MVFGSIFSHQHSKQGVPSNAEEIKFLREQLQKVQAENQQQNKEINILKRELLISEENLKRQNQNNQTVNYHKRGEPLSCSSYHNDSLSNQLHEPNDLFNQMLAKNEFLETTLNLTIEDFAKAKVNYIEKTKIGNDVIEELKKTLEALSKKIIQFAKNVAEKEKGLPEFGDNNTEEIQMQKFINFVLFNTEHLHSFVSDCFDGSSQTEVSNCENRHNKQSSSKCNSYRSLGYEN